MLTMQDYELAAKTEEQKKTFILQAITEHKASEVYRKAESAQNYYARRNEEIIKRLSFLEQANNVKLDIKFHKLRNGFFPKAIKRLVLYALGNGATLEDNIKEKLDPKFDKKIINIGLNTCVDGVNWLFNDIDPITVKPILHGFRATEFVPLVDERTSLPQAGIRFWQIDEHKPMYVELYEINGITEFKTDDNGTTLEVYKEQRPYKLKVRKDAISTTIEGQENYGVFPIIPIYANELKESELNDGLKCDIDAFDFVFSDLIDDILQNEGIYAVVKNFGGNDLANLLAELRFKKASSTDDDTTGVDINSVEVPFNAKQVALENLDRKMHSDWLLPDEQREGRQVTATEIKAGMADLDMKADLFEPQIVTAIESLLLLQGIDMIVPDFKRRTLTNDTETVDNISKMHSDGYIDDEMAIELNPLIPQDQKQDLLKRLEVQALEQANETFPIQPPIDETKINTETT